MTERIKIFGPPGTGKTYTMMAKYSSLLNQGYGPEDITCTTFRKSAAADLISKVQQWADYEEVKNHVGTLHSIGFRLLGYPDLINNKHIIEFAEKYKYMAYMKSQAKNNIDDDEIVYDGHILNLYQWMRNTRTPADKYYRYPGINNVSLPAQRIPQFIEDYNGFKEEKGIIDFSDMIEHCIQKKITLDTPVLMVDEFQDLTGQQYELFKLWSNDCETVVIAGDPLQSLYGFWGGSPDYFNEWNGKEVVLHNSHRLQADVWNLAKQILKYERQYPPEVTTKEGTKALRHITHDMWPEHQGSKLHLVRCNYQANAIAMRLAEAGKVFGGVCGWSESEMSLYNAIIKIRTSAPLISTDVKTLLDNYAAKYFQYSGRKQDLIKYLETDYKPTLIEFNPLIKPDFYNILKSDKPASYISNCGNLKLSKINNALKTHPKYITEDSLKECQLLTIHGAKGLEADTVYMHTAITPRIRKNIIIPGEESQAEARVWYVGVTRAKENLYLVKDEGHNYGLPVVAA
ncbi:UvrD-helicase domain-containing protein [Methanolobus sp. WCC5]|uniref:UvrD-helicase domain-containing protein n=1 Tax=Methanolobus sp. WCC5 TaxID=3125785 RepID=UPI00324FE44E